MKKKKIIFGSTFCVLMLVMLPTVSPMNINSDNESIIVPMSEEDENEFIINSCWEAYNNQEVRDEILCAKENVITELDKLTTEQRAYIENALDLCISLDDLYDRLKSLSIVNLWKDLQDLFGVIDDKDDAVDKCSGNAEQLLKILDNNGWNQDLYYPFITAFCILVGLITWTANFIIMSILPGTLRGLMSCAVFTSIVFAPITVKLGTYIAVSNLFKDDPEFREYIKTVILNYGFIRAGLETVSKAWDKGYINDGWTYVGQCLCMCWTFSGGYTNEFSGDIEERGEKVRFDNHPPYFSNVEYKTNWFVNIPLKIKFEPEDIDDIGYANTYWARRDRLQIGLDDNNDGNVEYWYKLEKAINWVDEWKYTFKTPGWHGISLYLRDMWGSCSDPIYIHVYIRGDGNDVYNMAQGIISEKIANFLQQQNTVTITQ